MMYCLKHQMSYTDTLNIECISTHLKLSHLFVPQKILPSENGVTLLFWDE